MKATLNCSNIISMSDSFKRFRSSREGVASHHVQQNDVFLLLEKEEYLRHSKGIFGAPRQSEQKNRWVFETDQHRHDNLPNVVHQPCCLQH